MKNPLLDVSIVVVGLSLIFVLPPVLATIAIIVAIVSFLAVILNGISFVVRLGQIRQVNGYLVLTEELASFIREGSREFSIRWSAVTRFSVVHRGRSLWRIRLSSRVASVDVLLRADKRTIAALRAELKARTGSAGTVSWGTAVKRKVANN